MRIGDTIRALTNVNIREAPGLSGAIEGKLLAGDIDVIVGSSVSKDALTWWPIDRGWVAEVAPTGTRLLELVLPLTPWDKCIAFILKWEGGFQIDPNDPGNWTGGKVDVGVLKGTKYGISAASYPSVDIRNLTIEKAKTIYFQDFWPYAVSYPWPMSLAALDLAVNGGPGRLKQGLLEGGATFHGLMAWRIDWYTRLDGWNMYGRGWIRRCADLIREAGK